MIGCSKLKSQLFYCRLFYLDRHAEHDLSLCFNPIAVFTGIPFFYNRLQYGITFPANVACKQIEPVALVIIVLHVAFCAPAIWADERFIPFPLIHMPGTPYYVLARCSQTLRALCFFIFHRFYPKRLQCSLIMNEIGG